MQPTKDLALSYKDVVGLIKIAGILVEPWRPQFHVWGPSGVQVMALFISYDIPRPYFHYSFCTHSILHRIKVLGPSACFLVKSNVNSDLKLES